MLQIDEMQQIDKMYLQTLRQIDITSVKLVIQIDKSI